MGTHIAIKLEVGLELLAVLINLAGNTVICLYHFGLGNFNFLLGVLGKWIILSLPPLSSVLGLSTAHAFSITNEVLPFAIHPQHSKQFCQAMIVEACNNLVVTMATNLKILQIARWVLFCRGLNHANEINATSFQFCCCRNRHKVRICADSSWITWGINPWRYQIPDDLGSMTQFAFFVALLQSRCQIIKVPCFIFSCMTNFIRSMILAQPSQESCIF